MIYINRNTEMWLVVIIIFTLTSNYGSCIGGPMFDQKLTIEWGKGQPDGTIEVSNGQLSEIKIIKGRGKIQGDRFKIISYDDAARISITIINANINAGQGSTIITVNTKENPFSFFLRDVDKDYPIYISDYHVVVCHNKDNRSLKEVKKELHSHHFQTKLQKISIEPEESYELASKHTRNSSNPTWLGLGRDIRIFEVAQNLEDSPSMAGVEKITARYPYEREAKTEYFFNVGRGSNAKLDVERKLDEGVLPILHSTLIEEDIKYHSISFVSLEKSILSENLNIGTDHLVADSYSMGTKLEKTDDIINDKTQKFLDQSEETVLYHRTVAKNTGVTPRYAWFRTASPSTGFDRYNSSSAYDKESGFFSFFNDTIYCISKLNGNSLPSETISILLKPGEEVSFEFRIPHNPISKYRAGQLSNQSFEERYADCKIFWKRKIDKGAQIHLPEERIENMIKAGLLHLDLITFGVEPNRPLATNVGRYCPIGTESSPIIQFYNSMGLSDQAKRSLMHFFEKQRDDGFMQNYTNYMGETGAVLWSAGEYFRYTNDENWVEEVKSKLIKSCDYLLNWREKNKIDSLKGKGYGMIDGSVADPVDLYRQFMLNGYSYLGLSRVSEMLTLVDPIQSARLRKEAELWKQDIRETFFVSMGNSPVIPFSDGSWGPTAPPWPGIIGPKSLFGSSINVDALLGPLYLVFCEVIEPSEKISKMMLKYHSELFYQNNVAFGQPYYSRHNWLQLKLGLTKPFLKTYYNTFSAHADRETYTFREGYDHQVNHKTHEEAWFLMQTRWMLYMEENRTLKLLSGIPRNWMKDGEVIEVSDVSSYFGSLSFKVSSHLSDGYIYATVACDSERKPESVIIRIPHPSGKKPIKVNGGTYDYKTETIKLNTFSGNGIVQVEFEEED